jgi:hypothetical protein
MKTLKIGLILAITLIALTGLSNMALARTHVSVGVGIGYPGFYGGYYGGYYGRGWHHHDSIFIGGYWPVYEPYPYYYPSYYDVEPASVVVERPPVVERQPVYVQPPDYSRNNDAAFQQAREKKNNLLNQLNSSDKAQRLNAIRNLVGFSYDDNVRIALENIILTDNDPDLRIAVANAFGSVKNMKVLPTLERIRVDDESAQVRQAVDNAIKNINRN